MFLVIASNLFNFHAFLPDSQPKGCTCIVPASGIQKQPGLTVWCRVIPTHTPGSNSIAALASVGISPLVGCIGSMRTDRCISKAGSIVAIATCALPGLTQPKEGPSKHSLEICTWSYSPALLQLHWCAPLPGPRSRMFGCNTSGWCSGIPPLVAAKYGRERSAFRPHPIGYFSNLCKPKWL